MQAHNPCEAFVQSHEKLLKILDLFDEERTEQSFEDILGQLGYSRSTLYRHLKVLTDAGLISSFPGRGYTLGPRIIQMDRQIMMSDPMIRVGCQALEELVAGHEAIGLLCRRYRQAVLCVHQASSTTRIRSNYERGLARPMLRGAASLVILAQSSPYQLGRLYEETPEGFAAAGLGTSLADVRAQLHRIRQKGWYHTRGEVTPGVVGVAAPILDGADEAAGSISLTLPEDGLDEATIAAIGAEVEAAARVVNAALR